MCADTALEDDLASGLGGFLDACHDGRLETLEALLDTIVSGGQLRDYLVSSRTRDGLARIARHGAPEAHPNGFSCVAVAFRPSRWRLRLHLWTRPAKQADIHSHRWNFASRLLAGSLSTRSYRAHPEPGDHLQFACGRSAAHGYTFRCMGSCRVSQTGERTYRAGDAYGQDWRGLHTVDPAALPAMTVVLQGKDLADESTVVTRGDVKSSSEVPIMPLTVEQIRQVIDLALAGLPG
jgi:hypothetical protein